MISFDCPKLSIAKIFVSYLITFRRLLGSQKRRKILQIPHLRSEETPLSQQKTLHRMSKRCDPTFTTSYMINYRGQTLSRWMKLSFPDGLSELILPLVPKFNVPFFIAPLILLYKLRKQNYLSSISIFIESLLKFSRFNMANIYMCVAVMLIYTIKYTQDPFSCHIRSSLINMKGGKGHTLLSNETPATLIDKILIKITVNHKVFFKYKLVRVVK